MIGERAPEITGEVKFTSDMRCKEGSANSGKGHQGDAGNVWNQG